MYRKRMPQQSVPCSERVVDDPYMMSKNMWPDLIDSSGGSPLFLGVICLDQMYMLGLKYVRI